MNKLQNKHETWLTHQFLICIRNFRSFKNGDYCIKFLYLPAYVVASNPSEPSGGACKKVDSTCITFLSMHCTCKQTWVREP